MTTPNINSRLAVPFKKVPVESSTEFKDIWADKKEYVRLVSGVGQGGTYQERKEQRRSETFPWPGIPPVPEQEEGPDRVSMTASGRMSGSDQFMDYETSVANRAPHSDQLYLVKIEELKDALKLANSENWRLSSKIKELNEKLNEKQCNVQSLVKTVADLKRRVSELEQQEQLELPGKQLA